MATDSSAPSSASRTRSWTESPARVRLYGYVGIVGLIGLLATVGLFMTAREIEQRRSLDRFTRLAEDRAQAVRSQVENQLHALHALQGYFAASDDVRRSEFEEFAGRILSRASGIQAFEWVPRVTHAVRGEFEAAARADGLAEFAINERAADGSLVVASERPVYFPVFYVVPMRGNEPAIGFDVASNPVRRLALEAARESRGAASSGPITLVQETSEQTGVLIFIPVFRAEASRGEREASLDGYVLGVFRVGDLLDAALSRFGPAGVDVRLFDDSTSGSPQELAHFCADKTGGAKSNPASPSRSVPRRVGSQDPVSRELQDRYRSDLTFTVAGRLWRVSSLPTARYISSASSWAAEGVLISGILITLVLTGYVSTLVDRRLVELALLRSEERFRVLVENAPEAIVVLDGDTRRFVDVNDNAVRLFKMSREELLKTGPFELSPAIQPDDQESESYGRRMIEHAFNGEAPVFEWSHLDAEGNEIPCEIRLVLLPSGSRRLLRGSITDISDRRRVELRRRMLMRELDHRVKNTLAVVLSIAEQSLATSSSLDRFQAAFTGRIRALAALHVALAGTEWRGVELEEVARLTLGAYIIKDSVRVTLNGEPTLLPARASSPICMALHELTTNAAKHGALSAAAGRVDLAWQACNGGPLTLIWQESGGPVVVPPVSEGYGFVLLKGVIEYELSGKVWMEFQPQGLRCTIEIPAKDLAEPPDV